MDVEDASAEEEAVLHPPAPAAAPPDGDPAAPPDRPEGVQGPGHKNLVKLRSAVKTVSVCQ